MPLRGLLGLGHQLDGELLPDVGCRGQVVMLTVRNRQLLHGSFANTSDKWRVTVNMGCLPRQSVIGVRGGGIVSAEMTYDEEHIEKRSRAIAYAIDARRQKYPGEEPFAYAPFAGHNIVWDQEARETFHDYSVMDMSV